MQIACTFYRNETYKQLPSANEDKNKSTVKSKPLPLSIAVEWILLLPCVFSRTDIKQRFERVKIYLNGRIFFFRNS